MDQGAVSRRRLLQASGAALALVGAGPASALAEGGALTIGSLAGIFPDLVSNTVVPDFSAANPGFGVKVVPRAAAEAYPKMLVQRGNPIESGGMWNDTFAALGAKANLFDKPDETLIPTLAHIPDKLRPTHGFGIPIAVQPYGIAYNPDRVEKPTSWLDLFDPRYAGKVVMHENFWDQYVMLAKILGGDEHNLTPAIDEWAKHKRNIGVWTNSFTQLEELVDRGEMWLGPQWGGFTVGAQRRGLKLAFAWPKEGCTQQTMLGCISKGTPADITAATQKFWEYVVHPAFQTAVLTKAGLSPTNSQVPIPPEFAEFEGVINPLKPTRPLFQYDFAYVGEHLPRIRREIDEKLRG